MFAWCKSSYSGGDNNCVETAHVPARLWSKSSYGTGSANCVEVADAAAGAAMRDTKHRELGALFFDGDEWQAFLSATADDFR